MYDHLLIYRFGFKVIGPIKQEEIAQAERLFRRGGYQVKRISSPPSAYSLRLWEKTGKAIATDGCAVYGLESCKHGHRSWLAVYKEKLNE